jgi:hypothetical protein
MTKTRLTAALSLALLVTPVTQAAKYEVIELPVAEKGKNSFSSAINQGGDITAIVQLPYNVPIDLTLLDFESSILVNNLTDLDAAKNGDFNQADYEFILAFVRSGDGLQNSQQIATTVSYLSNSQTTDYITGFDQPSMPNNTFSLSTNTTVRDINDAGLVVGRGEGFYDKVAYTNANGDDITFVVREFGTRAFVNNGTHTIGLPPIESLVGGYSEAFGINNNSQVVGYGSSSYISDNVVTGLADCQNEELVDHDDDPETADRKLRGDIPVESCISNLVSTVSAAPTNFARLRGHIWQLDDSGNLLDTKELGLLFEPEEDDTLNYASQAVAINDNGIAVGSSNGKYVEGDVSVTRNFAVIFENDQVINITPEIDRNVARTSSTISTAVDINNTNMVTGYQVKSVNGQNRTKVFVYDMNTQQMTFPNDFFLGSSSVPVDINNNGLVVGFGEVDASLTGRRKEGFLYDSNTDEFFPIRNLVSCDSPYTIIQANGINDQGQIAATALYQDVRRNSRGEIFLDEDGNQLMEDKVVAVKLEPIVDGQVEVCAAPGDDINRERQGASAYWLLSFGLLLLFWRRFRD